jgi:mono/diheme cytochrome c family protein
MRKYPLELIALASWLGCGGEEASTTPVPDAGMCVPSAAEFASVRPLFEAYCSACHGAELVGGAPFSLLDYDALLAADASGVRPVDRIGPALRGGAMPPGASPQPSALERAVLAAWASCSTVDSHDADAGDSDAGTEHHHDAGSLPDKGPLTVSREPLMPSGPPPVSAEAITLTLDEHPAPIDGDEYESRFFSAIVSEPRFIRYFEPVVDDARVVHHLTLRFSGSRTGYLYTWGPGGSALEFPDGGLRVTPEDTLHVEVHYHNGARIPGILDSSGVRLYVDAPVGTEYGLANLASWDIYVPPHGTGSATERCDVPEPVHVFAAWPHMHEVGEAVDHQIVHADGSQESLIALTGWDFHSQRIYAVGVDLVAGDRLELECRYVNRTDQPVSAGPATTNEMCFDFLYVTPPHALDPCNDRVSL